MNIEKNTPVFIVNGEELEELLRDIIQDEVSKIGDKLKRNPKILTRSEAAKHLKVSPNTISRYVRNGVLPNRGKGHKVMVLESDLDSL